MKSGPPKFSPCAGAILQAIALFTLAAALHLAGASILPLVDRDEPRFAEASREMRQRSDYVVPFFNNQFRFDKPPLIYWLQVGAYRWLGETDFAARLPGALAAAGTALVIFGFGARLYDRKAGAWAAVIFTTSLQTMIHGKLAVADMPMVFAVTLAAWAGYEALRAPGKEFAPSAGQALKRPAWLALFYGSLALGFLAKGPIAWAPLLGALLYASWKGGGGWRRLHPFIGIAGMLGLVALWGIPALLRTGGQFFWVGIGQHVVVRSIRPLNGHGPKGLALYLAALPFYFVTVFASFFPWSLSLPWAVKQFIKRYGDREVYLAIPAALVFGIFTLIRTKLPHYTLPAFPFLSLLLAAYWCGAKRTARALWIRAACMGAFGLATAWLLLPRARPWFPAQALAEKSAPLLRPQMAWAAVDFNEPSLVWCFRRRLRGYCNELNPAQAAAFMDQPGPRLCILRSKTASAVFPKVPRDWRVARVSGIDVVKGRRVDLTLVAKLR